MKKVKSLLPIFYCYEHWRLDRDECFYVGKGCGSRAYDRCRGKHWRNIVNKLERTGSSYEVRIVADGLTEKLAFDLEKERIVFWRDLVDLANDTLGGEGPSGAVRSPETRARIAEKSRGNKNRLGKRHSDEAKAKMGKANKGRQLPASQRAKMSLARIGRKTTEQTREKIASSLRGNKNGVGKRPQRSVSHCLKLREAAKAQWVARREAGYKPAPYSAASIELMSAKAKAREAAKRAAKISSASAPGANGPIGG